MSDRERLKLFNKLCKTCSRHRVIPKSMHIPDCSETSVQVARGGFADVSQGTYQGRQVAIKVVRVCLTSDLDVILQCESSVLLRTVAPVWMNGL
jgi:ribosomal protein L37AE/L43A